MHTRTSQKRLLKRKSILASTIATILSLSAVASAQEENTEAEQGETTEIIEVRGIADSFRNAIAEKRNSNTIVDALSSADIGALPDLSVAETLERITGVTGDRFKGNASEISIRGLGPFLGFATVNGRAISSGSGNRSVAFSQFPSELVNGVVVYKAQKADILEGGVSGTVDLKTLKPVDYGKEQFRAEVRANLNPYHRKLPSESGWGQRSSASYVNNWNNDVLGDMGIAIGFASTRSSTPEESYNTSSTLRNCNSNFVVDGGGSNCGFSPNNAAANGNLRAEDGDYFFIPNSFFYRQMKSEEERDSAIFALQFQPSDDMDVNFDMQWSNRFYYEDRKDLLWDDGRRRISNWSVNDENALLSYSGESRISSYGEYRVREEDYFGGGLNLDWQLTDTLGVEFDASWSNTFRYQTRTWARLRGDRFKYDWENSDGNDWPQVTNVYTDFNDPQGSAIDWTSDIQSLAFFDADSEARNYRFEIKDEIQAYKLHFDYGIDMGIFYNIKYGVDYSSHTHTNSSEVRERFSTPSANRDDVAAEVAKSCAIDFPSDDFGQDANSNVTSWATFDTFCAQNVILNGNSLPVDLSQPREAAIDLTEDVTSLFAMFEFSTEFGDLPVDGNFGVRRIKTDITSVGIKTSFSVVTDPEGNVTLVENDANGGIERNVLQNSFYNLLPSFNLVLGVHDDVQMRFAAYKGLSRPDMWYFGAGRSFANGVDDDEFSSLEEALDGNVTARGNPFLEALESNNYDIATSWYINEDTMLSAALYYKNFSAKYDLVDEIEPVTIDGQTVNVTVSNRPQIVNDDSSINGYELTAVHKFDWLDGFWGGFGTSLNYNFANSDFETPERGSNISDEVQARITPANIAGLSKHNFSGQFYWENKEISARISYKYRSEYLKPFGNNLGQTNRTVTDTQTVDFDISYKINKNLKAKFQAINITNEPYVEQRVANEAYNRIEFSGPRYFIGFQYRM